MAFKAIKDRYEKFSTARKDKLEVRHTAEYDTTKKVIDERVETQFTNLDTIVPEFFDQKTTLLGEQIQALDKPDASDKEKAQKATLEAELTKLNSLTEDADKRDFYIDLNVDTTRTQYAEQLAARMDNTFNIKNGTKSNVDAAHLEYMVAVGVKSRETAEKILDTEPEFERKRREAKLKLLLGDPANNDDLGERGTLEVKIGDQRKLQSGLYEEKVVNETTGATSIERNKKGKLRETFGSIWKDWGEQGWKGKLKKITVAAAGGLALGLLGGLAGAGAAVGIGVAVAAKAAKAAGTYRLDKLASRSAADEYTDEQLQQIRDERTEIVAQLQSDPDADVDLDRKLSSARDRSHEMNKDNRRKVAMVGASALLGSGIGAGIHALSGSGFFGLATKPVKGFTDWVGKGVDSAKEILDSDDVHAEAGGGDPDADPTKDAEADKQAQRDAQREASGKTPPASPEDAPTTSATPEHVVTGEEMNDNYVEQVYRGEGLSPEDYVHHATEAINSGELEKVVNPTGDGTFYYKVTPGTMRNLGLTGDPTSTENVMRILANHSGGTIKVA